MGLAMIFKLGAMPYDMVERWMNAFGEELVPRIRRVLDCDAAASRPTAPHRIERGRDDFGPLDGGRKLPSPHERLLSTLSRHSAPRIAIEAHEIEFLQRRCFHNDLTGT